MENETKTLYCTNPQCQAKHLKSFALFVSRDAMNIEGLSEATWRNLSEKALSEILQIFIIWIVMRIRSRP